MSQTANGLTEHYKKVDKFMLFLTAGLSLVSLLLANWYDTWTPAVVISGLTLGAMAAVYSVAPGTAVSRSLAAAGLMVLTSLHIHQAHGMIEFHFGVFVLLAMLLYYRDWLPVIVAAATIAVHHLSFYYMQLQGVNVFLLPEVEGGLPIVMLHATYVVLESALLVYMSISLKREFVTASELMAVTDSIIQPGRIDLTVRTNASSDLLQRFDGYTENINQLVTEVKQSNVALYEVSQDLVSITQEVEQNSHAQHEQTDLIASAVEQMSASASEVSSNAEEAAEAAKKALDSAQRCQQSSADTEHSIKNLEGKIVDASQTISQLDQDSKEIGTVLDVIRGIAEQTNLLALNAAIEAARAGEQGRGFADEVRSLAQRTQQSTEEIDRMIEGLQSGSSEAVSVIEQSKTYVDNCVAATHENMGLMREVSGAIDTINNLNQVIASSSQEQSTVSHEISQNISAIVDSGDDTNQKISGAKQSTATLGRHAEELDSLCQKFKLS
jgi:methyl-accepting chemotaxis protein